MDTSEKVRENRLRRAARRQGLILVKSRTRDPRGIDYGCYGISREGTWVAGVASHMTMSIADVERYLGGQANETS